MRHTPSYTAPAARNRARNGTNAAAHGRVGHLDPDPINRAGWGCSFTAPSPGTSLHRCVCYRRTAGSPSRSSTGICRDRVATWTTLPTNERRQPGRSGQFGDSFSISAPKDTLHDCDQEQGSVRPLPFARRAELQPEDQGTCHRRRWQHSLPDVGQLASVSPERRTSPIMAGLAAEPTDGRVASTCPDPTSIYLTHWIFPRNSRPCPSVVAPRPTGEGSDVQRKAPAAAQPMA